MMLRCGVIWILRTICMVKRDREQPMETKRKEKEKERREVK